MGIGNFLILLVGLLSNLIVGVIAVVKPVYKKQLLILNIALGTLVLMALIISYASYQNSIETVKEKIISMINQQRPGYKSKTLSEICSELHNLEYDKSIYMKAIIELVDENALTVNSITYHRNSMQEWEFDVYEISK